MPISLRRVAFAALIGYPFSYNFDATLAGIPLRYRLYSSWGIPLTKIVQLLVILALTFWFGVFFISGVLFVGEPLQIPHDQLHSISQAMVTECHIHENAVDWFTFLFADSRPFGMLLLAVDRAAHGGEPLPSRLAEALSLDAAGAALPSDRLSDRHRLGRHARGRLRVLRLFPPIHGGYLKVLEVYLVAYVLIVLSHVPGGWGVLEAVMMTLLGT